MRTGKRTGMRMMRKSERAEKMRTMSKRDCVGRRLGEVYEKGIE
jgi:hypothetical protein